MITRVFAHTTDALRERGQGLLMLEGNIGFTRFGVRIAKVVFRVDKRCWDIVEIPNLELFHRRVVA